MALTRRLVHRKIIVIASVVLMAALAGGIAAGVVLGSGNSAPAEDGTSVDGGITIVGTQKAGTGGVSLSSFSAAVGEGICAGNNHTNDNFRDNTHTGGGGHVWDFLDSFGVYHGYANRNVYRRACGTKYRRHLV